MKKKLQELKPRQKQPVEQGKRDPDAFQTPREQQLLARERGYGNNKLRVNSDMIFTHKDMKKHTKGYDIITGEIEKRGRPADNQDKIFVKVPEPDKSQDEIRKEKEKNDAKKREALNKKLYKERIKNRWDRGW